MSLIPVIGAAQKFNRPRGLAIAQYQIERSLRLRSSASAYLNRTPASAGNRKTWTWSGWVKRGSLGVEQQLFHSFGPGGFGVEALIAINSGDQLGFQFAYLNGSLTSTQVLRDPSAWYHVIVSVDSTQATSSDRVKFYINGQQVTAFSSASYPTQNSDGTLNQAHAHAIGARTAPSEHFDGYLTEINFVDGQALTSSDFGEFNAQTGVWQPKAYAGTYGTNGFYLNFSDNASTSALGTDFSGNNNTWTTNNISLTAGATFDSMIDTPTPYADGGNGRGNYATFNAVHRNALGNDLRNGNLEGYSITSATSPFSRTYPSTIQLPVGKWYCEVVVGSIGNTFALGIAASFDTNGLRSNFYQYNAWDQTYDVNASSTSYGVRASAGQVIGMAVDLDAGTLEWFVNGSSQGQKTGVAAGDYFVFLHLGFNSPAQFGNINFGQRPFTYAPPTGFKALNTQNLPEPTIVDGGNHFNTVLYTGTGNDPLVISGVGFQPDMTWIKSRSNALAHNIYDAVRGVSKRLQTNLTNAESTVSGVKSFDVDGFTLGNGTDDTNFTAGNTYVAWNWKASDSAAVTNTDGSITSTVSANPTAGFSIVIYTGNGTTGATVGHGLGAAPEFVIFKNRNTTNAWFVYSRAIQGSGEDAYILVLNNTIAADLDSRTTRPWSTTFSSSVLTLGIDGEVNGNGNNMVAYCFSEVAGYSRFGSYTGNGSADGPMVFTGFRPAFVMIKRTDNTSDWTIWDTARNTFNQMNFALYPNLSNAEVTTSIVIDTLSNGIKIRNSNADTNASGGTYIFAAFSEAAFKYALAR